MRYNPWILHCQLEASSNLVYVCYYYLITCYYPGYYILLSLLSIDGYRSLFGQRRIVSYYHPRTNTYKDSDIRR